MVLTAPGIGPITALAVASAFDYADRFRSSASAGAYLGLTPRRYASGEIGRNGRISRRGDRMTRTHLYEAANAIMTRKLGGSRLRDWARAVSERTGPRKAKVALARREDSADQANDAVLVREDADDVGPSLHLLVQALQGVGAVQLDAVLAREGHVGEHVLLGLVHQRAELRPAAAELVGDVAPGLAGALAVGLDEGLADGGGDHGVLAARSIGERVAGEMNPAPLPGGADHPPDRGLQALVRVRDHQLHAFQAAAHQVLEKLAQNGSASDGPMCRPTISRRPSVSTAMAIIAATDTIRPPSRTLR